MPADPPGSPSGPADGRAFDAMAASYDELEPWYEHLYAVLHRLLRQELGGPPARPGAGAARAGPPAPAGRGAGRRGGRQRPRALDAGCGTGFQTALLLELGYDTVGLDLSAGLLAVARRRLPSARLVRGDLERLPWRDGAFDAVVSCGSTLSFVGRPERAVAEIGRVLRPGGRVFLEVEHRWSLDLLWRLASSLAGDPLGYGAGPAAGWRALAPPLADGVWMDYPGYPRLRLYTGGELDRLLAAACLARRRAWGIHAVTGVIPSTVLHRPRVPRGLARLYAALARLDRAAAGTALARATASSLVVSAVRV